MVSKRLPSVSEWAPSPSQQRVGILIASGDSQSEAARKTNTSLRTVQDWWTDKMFRAYVFDLMAELAENYEEEFSQVVMMALRLEAKALRGELPPGDDRAKLAHNILSKTAYRIAALRAVNQQSLPGGPQQQQLPPG